MFILLYFMYTYEICSEINCIITIIIIIIVITNTHIRYIEYVVL